MEVGSRQSPPLACPARRSERVFLLGVSNTFCRRETLNLRGAAREPVGEQGLSRGLLMVAACLWSKEALNRWFQLRGRKRQKDLFTDTEDAVDPSRTTSLSSEPPLATRKKRIKRSREANAAAVDSDSGGE